MSNKPTAAQVAAYRAWVRVEARKIGSDGCTAVSEWHQDCCLEHDLACYFGRDPRLAFQLAVKGFQDPWAMAPVLSRRDADKRFAGCNVSSTWEEYQNDKGFLQTFKMVGKMARSGVRYVGVRLGALWPF